MSKVFFISDLHIGHSSILNFAAEYRAGRNVDEHDQWLVTQWNSVVGKRDTVYVLGDVCFDKNKMYLFGEMRGTKYLVRGNHDIFPTEEYLKYFKEVYGLHKYKGYWLSHAPIHPEELRGKKNIHGHVHHQVLGDDRYLPVCVEQCAGTPIPFTEIDKIANTSGDL